jgi:hypothetical protein
MKEEATSGLSDGILRALATSGSSLPTVQKKKWQYICELLETGSLKKRAVQNYYLDDVHSMGAA